MTPLPPGVRVRKARFIPQSQDFSKSVQIDLFLDVIYLFLKVRFEIFAINSCFFTNFPQIFLMTFFRNHILFQIFAKSLPLKIPPEKLPPLCPLPANVDVHPYLTPLLLVLCPHVSFFPLTFFPSPCGRPFWMPPKIKLYVERERERVCVCVCMLRDRVRGCVCR